MKIYLITYSNGRSPDTERSLVAAKRTARRVSCARHFSAAPDGDWVGYASREDLFDDRAGAAPHMVQAVVRPVRDAVAYLAGTDLPRAWLEAVRQAVD